ncbi:DUF1433 domain-containing protein [Bacillus safensis]|uniref:DUF1433 domain-containing protein n=1 Tax=Bacillus safensis TaxID=561879 RepID=UPI002DBE8D98|nr:DUF1433 domain-containing protein [Bacillus safensis]MEC1410380.1 DUF1433 domain-containing protein [Bacillus safensis]
MRNTMKFSIIIVAVIISVTAFIVEYMNKSLSDEVVEEKSDQERAEEYAKKMKPKIEEDLRESDIHGFIKKITFKNQVTINPMGHIIVRGYINDEPKRFSFEALLRYESGKVDSMSYDPDLSDRFIDWEEYKDEPEVKENYLKSFTKEEREQYLRDIGEKE